MTNHELPVVGAQSLSIRSARFEDVPDMLRLIDRAIDHGCRDHYDERQRRSVYLGYASSLFIEALGPYEACVVESGGQVVGVAQFEPGSGLLRALFVDARLQGQGVGGVLLAAVESRACEHRCDRLFGAMSLNAVPFYRRAGFRVRGRPEQIPGALTSVPMQWMEKPLRAP